MSLLTKSTIIFSPDFWSEPQEELSVPVGPASQALPDVTLAGIPDTVTIIRAVAIFKFRSVENTNAAANKLDGAQHIQVQDDTPGTWRDAISFVDDQFSLAATTREGGDVAIGDHDISVEVDGNDTYNFQWTNASADLASLNFNDVQVGLRVWCRAN